MITLSAGAAALTSLTLAALAVLHVYWGYGGAWPAPTSAELPGIVVGSPAGVPFPSKVECLIVAALLAAGSVAVLFGSGLLPSPLPPLTGQVAAALVGLAFLGRGLYGFFDTRFRPWTIGSSFERLNVVLYSPFCLVVAAAVAVALWAR